MLKSAQSTGTEPKGKVMESVELMLKLGLEGGGAGVYLTALAAGGFHFYAEGSSFDLDERGEECWREWRKGPVGTLEEAMALISSRGGWIAFHPISVHPAYRAEVWELAQACGPRGRAEGPAVAEWARVCGGEARE